MRVHGTRVVSLCVLCAASASAVAQSATGFSAADSAAVARGAWARAANALARRDSSAARREVERAAHAWPVQPAYAWASAILAARAHDDALALQYLRDYADLGLGRDLLADPSFARLRDHPDFAAVRAAHDGNRASLARSRVLRTLGDSTFWPEGMDVDPRSARIYVASVRHRTVAVIETNGAARELWPRGRADFGSVLGVRYDAARDRLWVTTSPVRQTPEFARGDTTHALLMRVHPETGAIERRWELPPSAAGHILGDLAIGPRGDVFVTDSNDPVLYRLRPGVDSLEALRHPLFRSLQGLAPSPDGRFLVLSDYAHGLLRVDLESGRVVRLDDAPHSTSIGCDGIAWSDAGIIAVQNGVSPPRIVRFMLDGEMSRVRRIDVLDRNTSLADEPTIGAVLNGEFVYVANSQWEKFGAASERIADKPLTAPRLLSVPLR